MIINPKSNVLDRDFIDWDTIEYDPFKGKSYSPKYSGFEAFAMSALSGFQDGYTVNYLNTIKENINDYLDKKNNKEVLSVEQLEEMYGFQSNKPLSARVANNIFENKERRKYFEKELKAYADSGGSKVIPIIGMIGGTSLDVIPIVIGANLGALGASRVSFLNSNLGFKRAGTLGGGLFDSLEGALGSYNYQKRRVVTGEKESFSGEEVIGFGILAGGLGSLVGYNFSRPKINKDPYMQREGTGVRKSILKFPEEKAKALPGRTPIDDEVVTIGKKRRGLTKLEKISREIDFWRKDFEVNVRKGNVENALESDKKLEQLSSSLDEELWVIKKRKEYLNNQKKKEKKEKIFDLSKLDEKIKTLKFPEEKAKALKGLVEKERKNLIDFKRSERNLVGKDFEEILDIEKKIKKHQLVLEDTRKKIAFYKDDPEKKAMLDILKIGEKNALINIDYLVKDLKKLKAESSLTSEDKALDKIVSDVFRIDIEKSKALALRADEEFLNQRAEKRIALYTAKESLNPNPFSKTLDTFRNKFASTFEKFKDFKIRVHVSKDNSFIFKNIDNKLFDKIFKSALDDAIFPSPPKNPGRQFGYWSSGDLKNYMETLLDNAGIKHKIFKDYVEFGQYILNHPYLSKAFKKVEILNVAGFFTEKHHASGKLPKDIAQTLFFPIKGFGRDNVDDVIFDTFSVFLHESSHALTDALSKHFKIDIKRTIPSEIYNKENLRGALKKHIENPLVTDMKNKLFKEQGLSAYEDEIVADMVSDMVLKYFGFLGKLARGDNPYIKKNLNRVIKERGFIKGIGSSREYRLLEARIMEDLKPFIYRNANFLISLIENNPKFLKATKKADKEKRLKYIESLVILMSGGVLTEANKDSLGDFFDLERI